MRGVPSVIMSQSWQTESLRLTLFPSPSWHVNQPNWWTRLFGEPPEKRTLQPKSGVSVEEGPFEGGTLVLASQQNRIDWLLRVPSPQTEQFAEEMSTLGSFEQATVKFAGLMLRWLGLENCPNAKRIAFGAVLLQEVTTKEEGYNNLRSYLNLKNADLEGASDFLYQVNRRRDSRLPIQDLRINRLSRWSVSLREGFQVSMEPENLVFREGKRKFSCRLELDVNTVAEFGGELIGGNLVQVFLELVELGKEISEKGDIK